MKSIEYPLSLFLALDLILALESKSETDNPIIRLLMLFLASDIIISSICKRLKFKSEDEISTK